MVTLVYPFHPYTANHYAAPGSIEKYDIAMSPSLYRVEPGHHLQFVLTTQALSSDCASLLSALTTPLPCILSTPQQRTLPGGKYEVMWGGSHPSSLNVGLLSEEDLVPTTSGVTPTSQSQTEPLGWGR